MAYFSTILAAAFLVTAQAAVIAAHPGPDGTHRQEPNLFVEVAGTGDATELRPEQPAPMYNEFYNAPASGGRQYAAPPTWPSQSLDISASQQDFINERLNEKMSLVRRQKDSNQEQDVVGKAKERARQAEQMALQKAQQMAEQNAHQEEMAAQMARQGDLMAEQKARQAEEMADQRRAAENAQEKARQAAAQKTVEQDAQMVKTRAQEKEETERLQRQQTVRQEASEDMRRRESELEWKEQDPAEDDDDDDPNSNVDWAHEDRLRGWGREGWTQPKPSGVVHHHQDAKPTEAPKESDRAAAAAATAAVEATAVRKPDVPVQGATLPTSDLTPDLPLLQTSP